ncbi:Sodium/calcium exchanger protein-domain-containing protein [Fomitopsis serialis]|uniref:Sodium/calcium exchanger protein-domain-containing protein n=1 Tax=Fomitopsis serialis TaxID=139415 RepID=UPI0020087796|nr:Sodium/calcium exchanger protein-domain-containing protein [Neoantrodia serialis]KAH9928311.1 Sodium/calcium exchanger protein-domain-containing protein [Neoantrodia serialis]
MAGVTFLAFGNGSPDVFATFSAMKANSGGLAIGELLGAATFVVSCVAGSLCIIKPFRVLPYRFFRDVGFFTVAVAILLVVLWDSELEAWEAAALISLYLLYVVVVVGGSFWEKRMERRRRYEELMRDEFREEVTVPTPYHDDEPYRDDPFTALAPSSTLEVPTPYTRTRAVSHPGPPRLGLETELPPRPRTRSPSPHSSPHLSAMPSFSLVGALEFRRIVSSLQQEAAGSSLSVFDTPSPYPGGHYHRHGGSRSRSRSHTPRLEIRDPWDAALGVPLDERSPPLIVAPPPESAEEMPPIPTISHTPASPVVSETDTDVQSEQFTQSSRRHSIKRVLGHAFHLIFPTLHGFRAKPFLGKVAAILAAPAVMVLTLTLPVVVTAYDDVGREREKHHERSVLDINDSRLVDFEEEGVERALIAEEEVAEEMHELKYNKWLMAVQCTLGPLFAAAILFDGTKHEPWLLLATGVAGFTIGILVLVFSDKGSHPTALLARCIMGFMVAVVWIMAIADEVVEVLTTFGFIFGLSDAIIGLTIFAVGNSLADLVANMSVAVFAPIMGFSACFGGPMLNILLGIGISGSYIIRQTAEPYYLHFSTTLVVTGCGLLALLLATLVFVPLNGFFLPRGWGITLIVAYTVIMITNVVVEIKSKS